MLFKKLKIESQLLRSKCFPALLAVYTHTVNSQQPYRAKFAHNQQCFEWLPLQTSDCIKQSSLIRIELPFFCGKKVVELIELIKILP